MKRKASIQFQNLHVNAIESTSGIFVGKNRQFCWDSDSKSNEGFGVLVGQENKLNDNTLVVKNLTAF